MIPFENLNGDKLLNALLPLLEKAQRWHEALSRGEIPSSQPGVYASKGSGMFGLK